MKIEKPLVDHYPPLKTWLDERGAFCVWRRNGKLREPDVECYRVNSSIALVMLHKAMHGVRAGWSIFTEFPTNEIQATLADADARTKPPEVTP